MHPLRRKVVTLDGRSGPGVSMVIPGMKMLIAQCDTPLGMWVLGANVPPVASGTALVTKAGAVALPGQGAPVDAYSTKPLWHPVYGVILFGGATAAYAGSPKVQVFAKPGLVPYTDWNEWANGTGGGTWQQLDTLPATQYGAAVCLLASGKVLIAGGTNSAGTLVNATAYIFTPGAGFTPITSIPALTGFSDGMHRIPDGRCVLLMADLSNPRLYAYNPANNGWTSLTPPPTIGGLQLLGGRLRALGVNSNLYVYDAVANTWAIGEPFNVMLDVPSLGVNKNHSDRKTELPTGEWATTVASMAADYAPVSLNAALYTPANGYQTTTTPTW